MAGIVYLRTNRFEVKLEGTTFKARDFESLCVNDFLFPSGKIWLHPPVVGLDVIRHPRDPNTILVFLCFGIGCVILRFFSGETLPDSILKFLTDERIRFVGFGIPEKQDLFPFEELGLTKDKADIGYLAAKFFDNSKYKRYELGELARKVLRIKRMIGLTDASSFERHEQIKCAICQLFISSVIAMALLDPKEKKKKDDSPKEKDGSPEKKNASTKKYSFLKNLQSLPLLKTERWFKSSKGKIERKNCFTEKDHKKTGLKQVHHPDDHDIHPKKNAEEATIEDVTLHVKCRDDFIGDIDPPYAGLSDSTNSDDFYTSKFRENFLLFQDRDGNLGDFLQNAERKEGSSSDDSSNKDTGYMMKKPLKGILKSPFSGFEVFDQPSPQPSPRPSPQPSPQPSPPKSEFPPPAPKDQRTLKRANSKGYNVSFK